MILTRAHEAAKPDEGTALSELQAEAGSSAATHARIRRREGCSSARVAETQIAAVLLLLDDK